MPQTPLEKYGTTGFCPAPFDKLRVAFLGFVKTGKSVLAQSDPHSVIASTENGCGYTNSQAVIIPDPQRHAALTWEMYLEVERWLVEEALAGRPPRKRVVFDTFDAWLELLDRELTRAENEKRKQASARFKTPLKELRSITEYGERGAGYHLLAKEALKHLLLLEKVGYGWTLNVHLDEKATTLKIGGKEEVFVEYLPTVYPTTWKLIGKRADYTGILERKNKQTTVQKRNPAGVVVNVPGPMEPSITLKWHSQTASDAPEKLCGHRIALPEIVLPASGGMEVLRKAYADACEEERAAIQKAAFTASEAPDVRRLDKE